MPLFATLKTLKALAITQREREISYDDADNDYKYKTTHDYGGVDDDDDEWVRVLSLVSFFGAPAVLKLLLCVHTCLQQLLNDDVLCVALSFWLCCYAVTLLRFCCLFTL